MDNAISLKVKIAEKNNRFWFRIFNETTPNLPPYQEGPFDTKSAALDRVNDCLDVAEDIFSILFPDSYVLRGLNAKHITINGSDVVN